MEKNTSWDDRYKEEAVKVIDEALIKACQVKLAHPEDLGNILLELARYYEQNANRDEIIV